MKSRAASLFSSWTLLALLVPTQAAAADACPPVAEYALLETDAAGGVGGTGHTTSPDGGLGGTGRSSDPGGEGGMGGTGIVGTITGFASICVNGLEVHYDNSVPVTENGKPVNTRGLAIGQVVVVDAGNSTRGLEARRIAILHAIDGPVTRPPDSNGRLEVMGARVSMANTQTLNQALQLKAGDWVQVSGHRGADGSVVASRVARTEARSEVSASGRADPDRMQVGGVHVDRTIAGELTVRGTWDGQRILVREARPADGTVWPLRPARVVIETRVRHRDGKMVSTGRADVDAALATRRNQGVDDQLTEGTLIRITGGVDDNGKLRPIRLERALRGDDVRNEGATSKRKNGDNSARTEDDRSDKEARKALEKTDKEQEQRQRNERDVSERKDRNENRDRSDRSDRNQRAERPERVDRSGRDH